MDFLSSLNPLETLNQWAVQLWQNEYNSDEATAQRDWSAEQAGINRRWQEQMRSTQYQTAVKDMMAAGLNPMLAYQHGGAGTPGGSMPSGAAASNAPHMNIGKLFSAAQLENIHAQTENVRAQTERERAVTAETTERTPTHAVTRQSLQQSITESVERIEKIRQDTKTGASSAAHLDQQTRNLQETVPHIRATIDQLRAQTKQTGAMTGLTEEQTRELRQRIAQNLPALENALKHLEAQAREADMPRRRQEESTHQSAIGTLSSILRALNPMHNFIR